MTARVARIAEWLAGREGEMIAFLEQQVNQDSGTYDRDGVNRVADLLASASEAIGSPTSRDLIEEAARRHDAAIPLEPGRPNGECVIARKEVGHCRMEVFGKQAHAGSQPELGVNAIWELAHAICALRALNDPVGGSTVNVGVVRGGKRPKMVPDHASADVDLRIWSLAAAERMTRAFQEIADRCSVPGARGRLSGEISNPPWQTNEGTRRMHGILRRAAARLGLDIAGDGTTARGGS